MSCELFTRNAYFTFSIDYVLYTWGFNKNLKLAYDSTLKLKKECSLPRPSVETTHEENLNTHLSLL